MVKSEENKGNMDRGCECHLPTKGRDMKEKQQKRITRHINE
jgi:hypothetical protein